MSGNGDPTGRTYQPTARVPTRLNARLRGPLDVKATLAGKHFVVVGGTGYLGKVLVSLMLKRYPEIGHIYLMVRPRKGLTPQERWRTEVWPSPAFDPVRNGKTDAETYNAICERVTAIAGDVTHTRAGIDDDTFKKLKAAGIDAVLNVAGVVSFTPALDEGFNVNTVGLMHLVDLCRDLVDAKDLKDAVPLLHTSTCYVAGQRVGQVFEDHPSVHPFPRHEEIGKEHWDPQRELDESMETARHIRARSDDGQLTSLIEERARTRLRARQQPTTGEVFEEAVAKERRKSIEKLLVDAGTERAAHWGWPNTYTYTKAVGEQLLAKSGIRYTIVRPAIVESALAFPFPGWNEGVNTSAPLIYLALHGHMSYPTVDGHVLDVIPVDHVCFGTLLAAAALLGGEADPVYQLGTSDTNPLTTNRLIELTGLYKRRFMRARNRGNPVVNRMLARIEPIGVSRKRWYRQSAPAVIKTMEAIESGLQLAKKTPVGGALAPLEKSVKGLKRAAGGAQMVMDAFLPFISELDYRFRCDNTRALYARVLPEDQKKLPFLPDQLDWRHYWFDVHLAGLRKWVFPHLDARLFRRPRPEERFSDLLALFDEVTLREGSTVALQRIVGPKGGQRALSTVTYRSFRQRVHACANRLADVGVHPGDRVGLIACNSPQWAIGFFGILTAGATVVALDPRLSEDELGERLSGVDVDYALLDASVGSAAEAACLDLDDFCDAPASGSKAAPPEVLVSPADVAVVTWTSGASGNAKPVQLSHQNLTAVLASVAPLFKLGHRDSSLSVMPLFQSFELCCGLLLPLLRGARVTYVDDVTQESLSEAFTLAGITAMVGVPKVWEEMQAQILDDLKTSGPFAEAAFQAGLTLNRTLGKALGINLGRVLFRPVHDRLGGRIRFLVSTGGHIPKKTANTFRSLGIELKQGYGLTEAAPVMTVGDASSGGMPVPGVEVEIHDVSDDGIGEIVTRGDTVMLGYLGDDDDVARAVQRDGWLRTGDLGRVDKKGRITVVARGTEVITLKNGGRLFPRELEEALSKAANVQEVAVVGIPDGTGGEEVAALVVAAKPELVEEEAGCINAVRQEVARLARRREVSERPDVISVSFEPLPTTVDSKIIRPQVIARIVAEQSARKVKQPEVAAEKAPIVPQKTTGQRQRLKAPGAKPAAKKDEVNVPSPLQHLLKRTLRSAQRGFYESGLKVTLRGEQHIPHNRQTIIAANHASHLDMGLVKHALGTYGEDLVTLAAKDYFFEGKWRRAYFDSLTNLRPLDRGDNPREAMREASGLLDGGHNVLIFPEGTRSKSGEMASFRPAVTYLALKHNLDILPMHLAGTYRAMPRGSFVPKNRHVTVSIGAPISMELVAAKVKESGVRVSVGASKATEALQRAIEALRDERPFDLERTLNEVFGLVQDDDTPQIEHKNPLDALFDHLRGRFQEGVATDPVTFYFSLGAGPESKWSVKVDKTSCQIINEKLSPADCVMKTDVPMFTRIVKEKYLPQPTDFFDGTIKTNDPNLLVSFVQVFNL